MSAGDVRSPPGGRLGREALSRVPANPGLCARCAHLQVQASAKSAFVRCGRSDADPRFPRYPSLPVLRCPGFTPLPAPPDGAPGEPPAGGGSL